MNCFIYLFVYLLSMFLFCGLLTVRKILCYMYDLIAHLHDSIDLQQLPESFMNFLSYSNFHSLVRIVELHALIILKSK